MRKNKLMFGIVLVLIAAALLPITHAQILGLSVGNMLYILTNALIIGIVLFLLQSVLVQGKEPKEKVAIYTIIAIVSLIIAFQFGLSDFIWRTGPLSSVFEIHVIGNAFIIGAVFYFIFGLADRGGKVFASPQGKAGFGIILFFIALFIALKLGNAWVWETGAIQNFGDFLFSPTNGIFNPDAGLYVFVASSVLLIFFFNSYLLPEGAGKSKIVNYLLALLFASNMAYYQTSMNTVIILGEIFFTLILQKALKDNVPKRFGLSWWLAILIVMLASYSITAGTSYGGITSAIFGIGPSTGGISGALSAVGGGLKAVGIFILIVLGFIVSGMLGVWVVNRIRSMRSGGP